MKHATRLALAASLALAAPHVRAQDDSPGASPETTPGVLPDVPRPGSPVGEVLTKAAESIRGLTSLSFNVSMRGEGLLVAYAPALEARVVAVRAPADPATWLLRITGSGKLQPDKPEVAFDAAYQQHFIEWIEPAERRLMRRLARPQPRSEVLRHAQQLRMDWLFAPLAFSRELGVAVNGTRLPDTELEGELCHVIEVTTMGTSGGKRRIYVGIEDGIVRRYEQIVTGQFEGSTIFQLSSVDGFNTVDHSQTRVPLPPGMEAEPEPTAIEPGVPAASAGATTPTPPTLEPPPPPPAPRFAAPFELKNAAGETVTLDALRGRPALLFFWGTWSLPSQDALPAIAALRTRYEPAQLGILGFAVRERSPAAAAELLQRENAGFSTLLSADPAAAAYGVRTYPTFILIGPEGQILHTAEGFPSGSNLNELADKIDAALKAAAGSA